MYYTIYKISCNKTGKIYIGKHQTKDLTDGYMGSGKLLLRAQKKYGIENFSKEILHVFDTEDEMNKMEAYLVSEEFCQRDDTFNLCPGGKGGWGYINQTVCKSDLVERAKSAGSLRKEKLKALYGDDWAKKLTEPAREKAKSMIQSGMIDRRGDKNGFKNKSHSNEWKKSHSDKMKELSKGSNNSQYGTMWITNGKENKKINKKDINAMPDGWHSGRVIKSRY